MISAIESFILKIFGGNSYFATFFISIVPLIELKGAIPFGMSKDIFEGNALPPLSAWIAASTGAFVPAIIIVWLFPKLLLWLGKKKRFAKLSQRLESSFKQKAGKLYRGAGGQKTIKDFLLLILFVAAPLPLTGAYTGAMVACVAGFSRLQALVCILIGNFLCGGIVTLLCTIFVGYELYIMLAFAILLIIIVAFRLVKKIYKRQKKTT